MTQLIEMMENQPSIAALNQNHLQLDDSKLVRVLVVEDDLTFKSFWNHLISEQFKKSKIDWVSSEEVAEGMIRNRFLKGKPYDLVIADIFLAGQKTGLELWFNFAEAATQFIFVSVLAENRFEQLMKSAKYTPIFLQKPLNPAACKEVLSSLKPSRGNYG